MNLLYVTNRNLARPGGARSHVRGFCKALGQCGVNVKVLSAYDFDEVLPHFRTRGQALAHYARRLMTIRRKVARLVEHDWADVIYYRKGMIDPGVYHVIAKPGRARLCFEINGTASDGNSVQRQLFARLSGLSDRVKLTHAHMVVTVSPEIREKVLRDYPMVCPDRVVCVNNGVDTDMFFPRDKAQCREKLGIEKNRFNIHFSGRAARWHGLATAIDALALLKQKMGETFQFFIVGDGPAMTGIRQAVAEKNLLSSVRFVGMVPHEQVPFYIGAADVCLAPFTSARMNRFGPSPLKMYEYVACARPVIASLVKPLPAIVEEIGTAGHIELVAPDHAGALATAMENMLTRGCAPCLPTEALRQTIGWQARVRQILRIGRQLDPIAP